MASGWRVGFLPIASLLIISVGAAVPLVLPSWRSTEFHRSQLKPCLNTATRTGESFRQSHVLYFRDVSKLEHKNNSFLKLSSWPLQLRRGQSITVIRSFAKVLWNYIFSSVWDSGILKILVLILLIFGPRRPEVRWRVGMKEPLQQCSNKRGCHVYLYRMAKTTGS